MYFLKESLFGNSKSRFILIEDNPYICSAPLVKAICKLYFKEGVDHLFIYYEKSSQDLHKGLGFENFRQIDAVSDSCSWNDQNKSDANLRSDDALIKEVTGVHGVVCIDSLSPLLFHNDVNQVYRALHRALTENVNLQFIAVLHKSVHSQYELDLMERLATTILSFTSEENQLEVTVRYSTGKVRKHLADFKISVDYDLSLFKESVKAQKSEPSKKPDPTANLTFNLKMKSSEIEARDQLVLPYTQIQKNDEVVMEDDMFEEEDPDDDLDI